MVAFDDQVSLALVYMQLFGAAVMAMLHAAVLAVQVVCAGDLLVNVGVESNTRYTMVCVPLRAVIPVAPATWKKLPSVPRVRVEAAVRAAPSPWVAVMMSVTATLS